MKPCLPQPTVLSLSNGNFLHCVPQCLCTHHHLMASPILKQDGTRCLIGPSYSCQTIHSLNPNGGWRLKLRKSIGNLLCPSHDISSELSTIGSKTKLDETGPDGYLYLDPSEKEMEPRQPLQMPQSRKHDGQWAIAEPLLYQSEQPGADLPTPSSNSENITAEDYSQDSPLLKDLWTSFSLLSSTITVDDWIKDNGIVFGDADSPANVSSSKGQLPKPPHGQATKENRITGDSRLSGFAYHLPCSDRGAGDVHQPVSSTAPRTVSLHSEGLNDERMRRTEAKEEAVTCTTNPIVTQQVDQSASVESQDNTPTDYTAIESTDAEEDTPWTLEDHRKLHHAVRRLKKQLDPLNYSDFGFTIDHGHTMLAFSNSVRKCILTRGTFGHDTEGLNRFLNVMMMETTDGPHRLEFELIKYAHLDKLVEEVAQFKARPPTLPFEQLQMIEVASDLLRHWRNRFGDRYFTLDRQRQKIVMEDMLRGLTFVVSSVEGASGWTPLGDRSFMSERDAEKAFSEGQWWPNMAAAHRDGVVGHHLDKPTKGRFGYTAIPLLMGQEENVGVDKVTYVREEKQSRKVPSLGDVPMLSLLGAKVRLLRGAGLKSPYAPAAGIRYDGVWVVSQYGHKNLDGANPKMRRLTLTLQRCQPRRTMADLSEIPTPATVDYYHLFENIEHIFQTRAATAYSYLEWHARKARLQLAREQWHRLRTFREAVESRRRTEEEALAKSRGKMDKLNDVIREGKEKLGGVKKEKENRIREVKESKEKRMRTDDGKEKRPSDHRNIFPGSWEMRTLMNVQG